MNCKICDGKIKSYCCEIHEKINSEKDLCCRCYFDSTCARCGLSIEYIKDGSLDLRCCHSCEKELDIN